jgi:hypothetical protein
MQTAALIVLPAAVLVLTIATAALVLPACAVGVFPFADACPPVRAAAPADRVAAASARRAALEAEVAALQRRVAALPACPPRRVDPPPEGIDPERWEDRDLGLLEGCWNLDSDMSIRDVGTGRASPVRSWRMCFDASGSGTQELVFENGVVCEGRVEAAFAASGALGLDDMADVQCDTGFRIFRRVSDCRLDGRQAACTSDQPYDPRGGRSRFTLRR